ncbi:hypothetical protein AU476_28480 [Cupriavidus sp. UYMSc13B]|nr:hypothetical protein AU476_28480 [Cupriavidus sp. UYMSc13B]
MEALMVLRGISLIAAVTVVAELGDLRHFTDAPQLMAYLGPVPSEHSSGKRERRGGITKTGNTAHIRMINRRRTANPGPNTLELNQQRQETEQLRNLTRSIHIIVRWPSSAPARSITKGAMKSSGMSPGAQRRAWYAQPAQ